MSAQARIITDLRNESSKNLDCMLRKMEKLMKRKLPLSGKSLRLNVTPGAVVEAEQKDPDLSLEVGKALGTKNNSKEGKRAEEELSSHKERQKKNQIISSDSFFHLIQKTLEILFCYMLDDKAIYLRTFQWNTHSCGLHNSFRYPVHFG